MRDICEFGTGRAPFAPEASLRRLSFLLVVAVVTASSISTAAWVGTQTGQVGMIQVTQNGSFSITLKSGPALCAAGGVNRAVGSVNIGSTVEGQVITAEGARAMLATLTAAKLAGTRVKIYAINGTSNSWGCQIGAVDLVDE